jgi:FixJ family two-component response regulator
MTTTAHVFVVDGDPSARGGLVRLLGQAGHDARGFSSAVEFLDAYQAEGLGCLVLDFGDLGLPGEKLLAELKARGAHLPIIVVTAEDDPGTRQRGHNLGAVGYFRKPVDGMALLDAISWALEPGGMT